MYGFTFLLGLLVGYLYNEHKSGHTENEDIENNIYKRLSKEELQRLARDIHQEEK